MRRVSRTRQSTAGKRSQRGSDTAPGDADSIGLRLQRLPLADQVLICARLCEERSAAGRFAPNPVDGLMDAIGLPRPARMWNSLAGLQNRGLLTRVKGAQESAWRLTPEGQSRTRGLANDMDLAALLVEVGRPTAALFGNTRHPVVPPSLAPPQLIGPLHGFFKNYPFERNVFGMTRFPSEKPATESDPIAEVLEAARAACARMGLVFHLASDRSIVDDLWSNVAAHIWGCRYGIAFFEERTQKGISYNLTIEVGSSLALGRRLALLKDRPLAGLPTDLVGHIYKDVDMADAASVGRAIRRWVAADLRLEL
jgi:hypothetical protein